ncbi:Eco57I restriction-modification methylase domain-containing protein [Microbacterium sp. zg.Y909]|uniref:Eco57I restriction-modification methylase domain-containing protein n=1 Tax=Microbacterium sp. zg.Y909 TaxID=2969413 RepID=UPI00214BBB81|nr:Eco57I restriction-modification methylase domain-containing protein [Microbacterium sp. zg.Y909]MCR2824290.1 Eco57I restriction-modification methylase domain-containing protein [Microbacterium sp. zg.Y909]
MSAPVLESKASFALRGHNPDVLTCIANLSNDEVFTPPELAKQMLDSVANAWAESHDGASIWQNPDVTFLDPFTKSGVFLREITSRLAEGLAAKIPDLQERVDHILTKQVYGIGITKLTALLARRSVYCSKDATGKHSIARSFEREWGNIWFERTEHTWAGDRCAYCPANRASYERSEELETHAYAFTHAVDLSSRLRQMFGADVQFDVIIGNPPYQLSDGGAGASAMPIYHRFVEQAKKLEPRLLSMIMPSRWMAGGRGLDEFRAEMLRDHRIAALVDFPLASDAFVGTEIKGGVCYFLWSQNYHGPTMVTQVRGAEVAGPTPRVLDEFDVFVRDSIAVAILHKVLAFKEESISSLVSAWRPFAFNSDFKDFHHDKRPGDLVLHYVRPGKRLVGYIAPSQVTRGATLIDAWKVFAPEGFNGGDGVPHQIVGRPIVAGPGEVCTGTYLAIGPFATEAEALRMRDYYATRFFRFLVSLRKITQHTGRGTFTWVPRLLTRDWTDEELYVKYGLTDEEITFIETQIKPMVVANGATDD